MWVPPSWLAFRPGHHVPPSPFCSDGGPLPSGCPSGALVLDLLEREAFIMGDTELGKEGFLPGKEGCLPGKEGCLPASSTLTGSLAAGGWKGCGARGAVRCARAAGPAASGPASASYPDDSRPRAPGESVPDPTAASDSPPRRGPHTAACRFGFLSRLRSTLR